MATDRLWISAPVEPEKRERWAVLATPNGQHVTNIRVRRGRLVVETPGAWYRMRRGRLRIWRRR